MPQLGNEDALLTPGISEEQASLVRRKLLGIPENYLEVIKIVDTYDVCLGAYELWPLCWPRASGLVECVIRANVEAEEPYRSWYSDYQLLEVAGWGGDPICVRKSAADSPGGEVYLFFCGPPPQLIARDFEEMIVLAANVHEIELTHGDNFVTAQREMLRRLEALDVPEHIHSHWLSLFAVNE